MAIAHETANQSTESLIELAKSAFLVARTELEQRGDVPMLVFAHTPMGERYAFRLTMSDPAEKPSVESFLRGVFALEGVSHYALAMGAWVSFHRGLSEGGMPLPPKGHAERLEVLSVIACGRDNTHGVLRMARVRRDNSGQVIGFGTPPKMGDASFGAGWMSQLLDPQRVPQGEALTRVRERWHKLRGAPTLMQA